MKFRLGVLLLIFNIPSSIYGQQHTMQQLAHSLALEREGHADLAIQELHTLLASSPSDSVETGLAWNILGLALKDREDYSDSQRAFERAVQILKRLPACAREYAMALDNFGGLLVAMEQPEAAANVRKRALQLYAKAGDHAGMAIASSDLAGIALSRRSLRRGRKYLREAEEQSRLANELSDDNRAAISSMQGWLGLLEGNIPQAVAAYRRSLDLWNKQHGEEHPLTGWGYVLLGSAKAKAGNADAEALSDIQKGVEILARTLGRTDSRYLRAELAYAQILSDMGAQAEAFHLRITAEQSLKNSRRQQCFDCTVSATAFR